ncbi:MAG: hypothetical protein HC851_23090 [Acaryochloris sp. RU_4_1]|nr:hypothetical protein [Acaryochloris sp. RU_4_1]
MFEDSAIATMIAKLGVCIPYHVQLFFKEVYDGCVLQRTTLVTQAFVEQIYTTKMLGSPGKAALSHLEERLQQVLGLDCYPLVLDLLTETAVTGSLTSTAIQILCQEHATTHSIDRPQDLARDILSVLQHDGYLQPQDGAFVFVSNLIRDWWQAQHGFYFVPAAQRRQG